MGALANFQQNLRRLMRDKKVSQRKLAELAGLGYPYVNRILTGKVSPSLSNCERIAEALDVDLLVLLLEPRRKPRC